MSALWKLLSLAGRCQCRGGGVHRHRCPSGHAGRGISRHLHPPARQPSRPLPDREAQRGVHFSRRRCLLHPGGEAQPVRRFSQPLEFRRLAEILRSHTTRRAPRAVTGSIAFAVRRAGEKNRPCSLLSPPFGSLPAIHSWSTGSLTSHTTS